MFKFHVVIQSHAYKIRAVLHPRLKECGVKYGWRHKVKDSNFAQK